MTPSEQERRRSFLGASEVAAVCGLDPWKSALDIWGAKKGLLRQDESDAADMGNLLEPVLLHRYASERQATLRRPTTLFGAEPWIAATPDALTVHPQTRAAVRDVQVKCVGRYMADHWEQGVPEYVQVQVQWELMVTGLAVADVVALICSTDYRVIEVQRDQRVIDSLLAICSAWWQRHIVEGAMPELDGSETARAILSAMHPERGGMVEAVPEFIEMAQQHQRLDTQIKVLTEQREHLRNLMRQCIGSNQGISWPSGRVTWKADKTGSRVLRVRTRETP